MKPFLLATLLSCSVACAACRQEPDIPPSIQEIKAKHTIRLLEQPGVVSVGLGQDEHGNPAIIVGMDGPRPETVAELPKSLEGYPVITRIIGYVKAR